MTIRDVMARRIWDSRGRPTVEVEVVNEDGTSGIGIAPAGASRGTREAVELRDGGHRFNGLDVQHAIAGIEREIAPALVGRDPRDQAGIDAMLIALDGTPNKSRLGGNTLIATSLAVLHAAAAIERAAVVAIPRGRGPRAACPCRRSRSSVAALTPGGAWTCRTSW